MSKEFPNSGDERFQGVGESLTEQKRQCSADNTASYHRCTDQEQRRNCWGIEILKPECDANRSTNEGTQKHTNHGVGKTVFLVWFQDRCSEEVQYESSDEWRPNQACQPLMYVNSTGGSGQRKDRIVQSLRCGLSPLSQSIHDIQLHGPQRRENTSQ